MKRHIRWKRMLNWGVVFFWMLLIFYFSAQPASQSSELSQSVTQIVVDSIERISPNFATDQIDIHLLVRKSAHFFVFLALGVWVMVALHTSRWTGIRKMMLALTICVVYAISDEVHQWFVPGRSMQAKDVFIDSIGATTGILLVSLFEQVIRAFRNINRR